MKPWFVTFVLLAGVCACGGSSSTPVTPTPAPVTPGTRVITVSGTLAFGNTQVGTPVTAAVRITNDGSDTLTVTGIGLPSGYSSSWTSGPILAGRRQDFGVTFVASALQTYNGALVVHADQTSGTNTLSVSGAGVAPSPNVPTLVSPGAGAVLPNVTAGIRPTWTFTWSAVPGATTYHLYVKNAHGTLPTIDVSGITATSYDFQLLGNIVDANLQDWQWMVQSDDGWSQTGAFSVAPGSSAIGPSGS